MSGCQNQNASEGSKIALRLTTESATLEPLPVTVERDGFVDVAGTASGSCWSGAVQLDGMLLRRPGDPVLRVRPQGKSAPCLAFSYANLSGRLGPLASGTSSLRSDFGDGQAEERALVVIPLTELTYQRSRATG